MIIGSSLKFTEEKNNRKKFSQQFPFYNQTFHNYSLNTLLKYRFPNTDFYIRGNLPSNFDYTINLWVIGNGNFFNFSFFMIKKLIIIGFLWLESQKMYHNGFKHYFLSWSNIFNFKMSVLYLAYFGLKYYTMIIVSLNLSKLKDETFWRRVSQLSSDDFDEQKDIYETFYWLNDGKP
jgi:hypothetical protein